MVIWALILFSLFTAVYENSSKAVLIENDSRGDCVQLNFIDYLRNSNFPLSSSEYVLPVFGPQLPTYDEDHVEEDENDSNRTLAENATARNVVTTSSNDVAIDKHRLEADLDRLLAQENRITETDVPDIGKGNETVDQQDSDPPLPSFNEWTKQKLEEQQHTKQLQIDAQINKNGGGNGSPAVQTGTNGGSTIQGSADGTVTQIIVDQQHARNYASKECGAKMLLVNPQAQHSSSVLNEKEPDEYMLNPCNAEQKFFVIELCETIQITRLDLANFELFSSSPKDFRVFVSERYPSTEWTFLGSWTAEDQRKIQHFPVEHRIYAKYVKVELISHYGSEHFCPLSLIRVLGVSVVEEYEAEAAQEQRQQQQPRVELETPTIGVQPSESAEKSEEMGLPFDATPDEINGFHTPPERHPDTGSAPTANFMRQELLNTAKDAVVHLAKGVLDKAQSVFGGTETSGNDSIANSTANSTDMDPLPVTAPVLYVNEHWRQCLTCDVKTNVSRRLCGYVRAFLIKRRPRNRPVPIPEQQETVAEVKEEPKLTQKLVEILPKTLEQLLEEVLKTTDSDHLTANGDQQPKQQPTPPPVVMSHSNAPVDSSSLPGVSTSGKESVFARLNSRIRQLETNISLSGEYLGELSVRYKKQMDDMHKALNKSNSMITQYTKSTDEKLAQYRADIEALQAELEKLKSVFIESKLEKKVDADDSKPIDFDSLILDTTISAAEAWAPVIALIEFAILLCTMVYCCRGRSKRDERARELALERRIRQTVIEELRKLGKNGVSMNCLTPVANGHATHDRSEIGSVGNGVEVSPSVVNNWRPPGTVQQQHCVQHSSSQEQPNNVVDFTASPPLIAATKPKKKVKKRQQQQQRHQQQKNPPLITRKISDQTAAFSNRNNENGEVENQDDTLNDSAAGILFSTSSTSTAIWRRVLPGWRKSALQNESLYDQQKRRNSNDQLMTAALNQRAKRKFRSQNAFEVLASSTSSIENHSRSPEKRPRPGRGPS